MIRRRRTSFRVPTARVPRYPFSHALRGISGYLSDVRTHGIDDHLVDGALVRRFRRPPFVRSRKFQQFLHTAGDAHPRSDKQRSGTAQRANETELSVIVLHDTASPVDGIVAVGSFKCRIARNKTDAYPCLRADVLQGVDDSLKRVDLLVDDARELGYLSVAIVGDIVFAHIVMQFVTHSLQSGQPIVGANHLHNDKMAQLRTVHLYDTLRLWRRKGNDMSHTRGDKRNLIDPETEHQYYEW